jgi:hypothetical protein
MNQLSGPYLILWWRLLNPVATAPRFCKCVGPSHLRGGARLDPLAPLAVL